MILQSLRELALREGLVEDPAFESKPVRWLIHLRPDGRFLQVYDTNQPQSMPEGSKRKPKLEATLMLIPRRCVRSVGIRANFLVDNAKYVLGEAAETDNNPKNAERHAAYRKLLEAAQASMPTPELATVLQFLDSSEQRQACIKAAAFEKYGWSGNENAPVCSECMTAYVEGLRRLTRARYINPSKGLQVHPLSTVLNGDTTAIYWADTESGIVDAISCLRDDPKRVKDLLESPYT